MTQEVPKHELLLKLLKMTSSDNDAEALVAIRKATALLHSAGWDWDRLLAGKITVVGDPFGNLQRPTAREPISSAAYQQPVSPQQPTRPARPAMAGAPTPQGSHKRKPTVTYENIFGSLS